MIYEVTVYKSEEDFNNRVRERSFTGLILRDESLIFAKSLLDDYPVVKWQSYDREEIEVFTNGNG